MASTGIGGEVGWWCPSLDTSGNGTDTVFDLAGNSNNGTLTNMDAATDWVADTANGGVRALDFDGANDFISTPFTAGVVTTMSMSAWVKQSALHINKVICGWWSGSQGLFIQTGFLSSSSILCLAGDGAQWCYTPVGSFDAAVWAHVAFVYEGDAEERIKLYINGVKHSVTYYSGAVATSVSLSSQYFNIGKIPTMRYWNGLIDDVRVFDRKLTAGEITLLASKRGYQPSLGIKRRRINSGLINMGLIR